MKALRTATTVAFPVQDIRALGLHLSRMVSGHRRWAVAVGGVAAAVGLAFGLVAGRPPFQAQEHGTGPATSISSTALASPTRATEETPGASFGASEGFFIRDYRELGGEVLVGSPRTSYLPLQGASGPPAPEGSGPSARTAARPRAGQDLSPRSAQSDWWAVGLDVLAKLALVLGLVVLVAGALRRVDHATIAGQRAVVLIHSVPLGQGRLVQIVDVGSRVLLLGSTPGSITLLAEFRDPAEMDGIRARCASSSPALASFADYLCSLVPGLKTGARHGGEWSTEDQVLLAAEEARADLLEQAEALRRRRQETGGAPR